MEVVAVFQAPCPESSPEFKIDIRVGIERKPTIESWYWKKAQHRELVLEESPPSRVGIGRKPTIKSWYWKKADQGELVLKRSPPWFQIQQGDGVDFELFQGVRSGS